MRELIIPWSWVRVPGGVPVANPRSGFCRVAPDVSVRGYHGTVRTSRFMRLLAFGSPDQRARPTVAACLPAPESRPEEIEAVWSYFPHRAPSLQYTSRVLSECNSSPTWAARTAPPRVPA